MFLAAPQLLADTHLLDCFFQPPDLALVELVDGHLDGQDVIPKAPVPLAPILGHDQGALRGDEAPLLQLSYVLSHSRHTLPDGLPDHPIAGQTLVGLSVLAAEQVAVDSDGRGGQTQGVDFVGQREVVLDGIAPGPVLFPHLTPPDCASAHWIKLFLGCHQACVEEQWQVIVALTV